MLKLDVSEFENYKLRTYNLWPFNIQENFASAEEVTALTVRKQGIAERVIRRVLRKPPKVATTYIREKKLFHFDPDILNLPDDVCLGGYWQSDRYFTDIAEIIRQEFTVKAPQDGKDKELADTEVRKIIRKTSSLETTIKAFKIASNLRINTVGYFMIGFPGETYEQASRTLDLIEEILPTIPCISICIPYPGTDSFKLAVEMGTIRDYGSVDWSMHYHHSNINFSGKINKKEWASLLKRSMKIEQEARRRAEKNIIIDTIMQVDIRKVISRYRKKPNDVFKDLFRIISIFLTMAKGGPKRP